jgi:hypothetical protein
MIATFPAGIKPLGYQQLTVSTTAVGLSVPAKAIRAVIGVEAQPIRWRDDGTNPTSSVGTLQKADTFIEIYDPKALNAFKAIRQDASDATLNISYYG